MKVNVIKNQGRYCINNGSDVTRWMGLQLAVDFWWMKPVFGDKIQQIPDSLQLFVGEVNEKYFIVMPTVDKAAKGSIVYQDNKLYVESVYGGYTEEIIGIEVSGGRNIMEMINIASESLANQLHGFNLRKDKVMPAYYDYFGWCTWDVFYREVSEVGVKVALETFKRRGISPYFMILDDGWQDVEGMYLNTIFENDKFPSGLKSLVQTAKEQYGIKEFGIWHALQGYWGGLNTDGALAKSFKYGENVNIKPCLFTEYMAKKAYYIHEDEIKRFYQIFYKFLSESGIDLVKVDSQGSLLHLCENTENPTTVMRAYQEALKEAGETYFNENVLYCMSHPTDVIYHTNQFSAWRNSDDFFPNKPLKDQVEHFYINAFNNLLTSTFSYPDWDMFQTHHAQANLHAAVRAISGGPVYVCDEPADINLDILNKLIIDEHKVLRFRNPALPLNNCIMIDPSQSDKLFKVKNNSEFGCSILVAHVSVEKDMIEDCILIKDFMNDEWISFEEDFSNLEVNASTVNLGLNYGEFSYVTMVPKYRVVTPLGLKNKYNTYLCIKEVRVSEDEMRVWTEGEGEFVFYVDESTRVESLWLNDNAVSMTYENKLLRVSTTKGGNSFVIKYKKLD